MMEEAIEMHQEVTNKTDGAMKEQIRISSEIAEQKATIG